MNPHPLQGTSPNPTSPRASQLPRIVLLFLFLFCLSERAPAQSAPTLIPFQARLTNQAGEAYGSGQYTLTFNLYDQPVGGSTVWTERHEKVGIVNGMVNVFLGSIATFPTWQPGSNPQVPLFTGTKYLGITVDADGNAATADPEMVPRTMLVNAFHAQNASNLAGYNWSAVLQGGSNNPQTGFLRADKINPASITNAQIASSTINTASVADNAITVEKIAVAVRESLIPPGTILPFGGINAPTGYLLCDGTAYSRTGTYAGLFAVVSTSFGAPSPITFNVPDFRGMFLRGAIPNLTATGAGAVVSNNITLSVSAPATAHPFSRTGMRVRVTAGNVSGLTLGSHYWIINVSNNQIALASSFADAIAGNKLVVSGSANGLALSQSVDPDASGRVAMSLGGGTGNAIGSIQSDEMVNHSHAMGLGSGAFPSPTNGSASFLSTFGYNTTNSVYDFSNGRFTQSSGGNETRPVNAYVNYIIKY